MDFNKDELLRMYVAMGDAYDAHEGNVSQDFRDLMEKLRQTLVDETQPTDI